MAVAYGDLNWLCTTKIQAGQRPWANVTSHPDFAMPKTEWRNRSWPGSTASQACAHFVSYLRLGAKYGQIGGEIGGSH